MESNQPNVFLDTSIFVSNNFFDGHNIKELIKKAHENEIKLFTSEIVLLEVKSQIKRKIAEARSFLKKKIDDKSLWILRNTNYLNDLQSLKKINADEESLILCGKIDALVSGIPIYIIPYKEIDLTPIIDDYFNENPPFKNGEKKYEFPDAFILASINLWCSKNKKEMILVSHDKDWERFNSKYFKIYNEVGTLLKYIIDISEQKKEKQKQIEYIDYLFKNSEEKILESIKEYLEDIMGTFDGGDEVEIDSCNIDKLEIIDYDFIDITNREANLLLSVTFDITANAIHTDYENSPWDDEFKEYIYVKKDDVQLESSVETEINILIEYNSDDEEEFSVIVESVNNNIPIDISEYDYY